VGYVLAHKALVNSAAQHRPKIVHVGQRVQQTQQAAQAPAARQQPQVVIHRHHHDHKHTHTHKQPPAPVQHDRRQATPQRRPTQQRELTEVLRLARHAVRAMQKVAEETGRR
jgi:hypothetical protein